MISIDLYMWFIFILIFVSMIFFSIDKIPIEITSVGIITILVVIFQNSPFLGVMSGVPLSLEVILKGFANPSLLALMSLVGYWSRVINNWSIRRNCCLGLRG